MLPTTPPHPPLSLHQGYMPLSLHRWSYQYIYLSWLIPMGGISKPISLITITYIIVIQIQNYSNHTNLKTEQGYIINVSSMVWKNLILKPWFIRILSFGNIQHSHDVQPSLGWYPICGFVCMKCIYRDIYMTEVNHMLFSSYLVSNAFHKLQLDNDSMWEKNYNKPFRHVSHKA